MADELAMRIEQYTKEQLDDMSMVEIAHAVLSDSNETFYYRDLMRKVAEICHLTQEEVDDVIARLYTDINIDGRFLCIGENVWGLRRWYPVEKATERGGGTKKFLRKDAPEEFDDDEDIAEVEEELLDEDPPFVFGEEEESFDEELTIEDDLEFVEEDAEEADPLEVEEEAEEDEEF